MAWPQTFSEETAPSEVVRLTRSLVPRLLDGDHPTLARLRDQFAHAAIESVELSGVGFFVTFTVPAGLPRTEPPNFAGGTASISIAGLRHGAGCVLFIKDGALSMFEVYTFDEAWPADTTVLDVRDVSPLVVPT